MGTVGRNGAGRRRWIRAAALAAFVWLVLALFPRSAGAILSDAGCPGPADGTISAFGDEREAQTFTAVHTGALTRATVSVNTGSLQAGDFVLQVLAVGTGGTPTDTVLASATIPQASLPPGGDATFDVTFSPPPPVVAGRGYAIAVGRPGNLTSFAVHTRGGNPCGGEIFHNTGNGWGLESTDDDFVFQTFVNPANKFEIVSRGGKLFARVPGPGTIVVDDVSTVQRKAAISARRKKRKGRARLVRRTTAKAEAAGDVELKLKLTKRAVRKILKRRRFDLPVAITYTPTGGDPNTETFKIKIRL